MGRLEFFRFFVFIVVYWIYSIFYRFKREYLVFSIDVFAFLDFYIIYVIYGWRRGSSLVYILGRFYYGSVVCVGVSFWFRLCFCRFGLDGITFSIVVIFRIGFLEVIYWANEWIFYWFYIIGVREYVSVIFVCLLFIMVCYVRVLFIWWLIVVFL